MKNEKDLRKAYDHAYALVMTVQTEEMKEKIIVNVMKSQLKGKYSNAEVVEYAQRELRKVEESKFKFQFWSFNILSN
ncbi:MAG: hypothetical protein SOR72_01610 [Hornefia sp.]|nr:hypothetical protein [Hornefia sp.]